MRLALDAAPNLVFAHLGVAEGDGVGLWEGIYSGVVVMLGKMRLVCGNNERKWTRRDGLAERLVCVDMCVNTSSCFGVRRVVVAAA